MVDGVPVVSVARAWVDLAANFGLADLVAAGDSALRLGCTMDELNVAQLAPARCPACSRRRFASSCGDARRTSFALEWSDSWVVTYAAGP